MTKLIVKNPEGNCGVASERIPDLLLRTLEETFEAYDRNYKELEDKLNEAKKVIAYYANEKNWEKKPTEIGEFSLMCFDDRGGTARDLLEKWGEDGNS